MQRRKRERDKERLREQLAEEAVYEIGEWDRERVRHKEVEGNTKSKKKMLMCEVVAEIINNERNT